MSSRVTRSMSAFAELAPMQSAATTRGKLRGVRKPTRGGKTAAAAGQLAPIREGELDAAAGQLASGGAGDTAVAAGQPVSVGVGATAGDGALAADGKEAAGESGNVAGPQDGQQDQGMMVSGPDHPLPSFKKADRATQTVSMRHQSNRWPLPWLSVVLALVAVFLAFLAPLAFSQQQSAKTASSLAELGKELQRLTNQTSLLTRRVVQIEKQALAVKTPVPSQINWLSWDLGARAIIPFSSPDIAMPSLNPAAVSKPWWCPWCKERHNPASRTWIGFGPDAALVPHTKYEVPYCTSDRMQLAVRLPRPIVPTELVIEFWRKDEVIVAGIAPRDVELWVEDGKKLVLAGKWIYNIHANQEAQKFPVAFADIAVQRVAIRIATNWGATNRTCLVRAKLHGIDKSGIEEKLYEQ